MGGSEIAGLWEEDKESPKSDSEELDQALVAGLMLEVILETHALAADTQARRRQVKARLKDAMATKLAGRVTLERFHYLLRQVEQWFPLYYPLISPIPPKISAGPAPSPAPARHDTPPPLFQRAIREDRLRLWFAQKAAALLPRRPHRKLHPDKLWEFLGRTEGGWFRLKDFEQHFRMDRKTSWEYVQKLLKAGLLRHNQGYSAAVRYALAGDFLMVRAEALEAQVKEALSGLPKPLAEQVTQWLIATGGEAFKENDWQGRLGLRQYPEVISRLQAADLLESAPSTKASRKFRLRLGWLQFYEPI